MKFFDSHCHLTDLAFNEDLNDTLLRMEQEGVTRVLTLGWDLESSKAALALAEAHENVYCAVGIHPENIEGLDFSVLDQIETMARHPKNVAIGEIGLDYHWYKEIEQHKKQKEWFLAQIELANRLNLPASIHARDASGDMLEILQKNPIKAGAVLHCYSGSVETLKSLAKLGYYFGFDGPITYKNAVEPKRCVMEAPLDRLLVETDSPYLAPTPLRGRRNDPANIPLIVSAMAELRGLSLEEMSDQLNDNFARLFHVKTL